MAPTWKILALLYSLGQGVLAASNSTTPTVQSIIDQVIPACAKSCVQKNLGSDFTNNCNDPQDLSCMCTHYGKDGYSVGELALTCLYTSNCGSEALGSQSAVYGICSNVPGHVNPTMASLNYPAAPTGGASMATSTPSPSDSGSSKKLSPAQIAAIVIVIVALIVVALTVFLLFFFRHRRRQREEADAMTLYQSSSHDSLSLEGGDGELEKPTVVLDAAAVPTVAAPEKEKRKSRFSLRRSGENGSRSWPKYYRISPPPSLGIPGLTVYAGNGDANTNTAIATATRRSGITDPNAKRNKPLISLAPTKSQKARNTRVSGFAGGSKPIPTPDTPSIPIPTLVPIKIHSSAIVPPPLGSAVSRSTSPLPRGTSPGTAQMQQVAPKSPLLLGTEYLPPKQSPISIQNSFPPHTPMAGAPGLSITIPTPNDEDEITPMRQLSPSRTENRSTSPLQPQVRSTTPQSIRSGTPLSMKKKNLLSSISDAANGATEGVIRSASPEIQNQDGSYALVARSTSPASESPRAAYVKKMPSNGRNTPLGGRKTPQPQQGQGTRSNTPVGYKPGTPGPIAVETDGTQVKPKTPITPMSEASSATGIYPRVPSGMTRALAARGSTHQRPPPAASRAVAQAKEKAAMQAAAAQAAAAQAAGFNPQAWESEASESNYNRSHMSEIATPSSKYSQSTSGLGNRRHTASGAAGFVVNPDLTYSPAQQGYHFSKEQQLSSAVYSEENKF